MEEKAYERGADSEHGYQRRHAPETCHTVHKYACDYEHQAVAEVSHTESEEQQEEYRDVRGRVEAVVFRTSVHIREDGEHLGETVAAQLDRRVVLDLGLVLEPEQVHLSERLLKPCVIFARSKTLEHHHVVFHAVLRSFPCEISVQALHAGSIFLPDLRYIRRQTREPAFSLLQLGLNGRQPFTGLYNVTLRPAALVHRERILTVIGYGHEPHVLVCFLYDLEGILLSQGRIESLPAAAVEPDSETCLFKGLERGFVECAPGFLFGYFLAEFTRAAVQVGYDPSQPEGLGYGVIHILSGGSPDA